MFTKEFIDNHNNGSEQYVKVYSFLLQNLKMEDALLLSCLINMEPVCTTKYPSTEYKDYFWVSNKFLMRYYKMSSNNIKIHIDSLKSKGLLDVIYTGTTSDTKRYIKLNKKSIKALMEDTI